MKQSSRILMGNAAYRTASLKKGMTQVTRVIKIRILSKLKSK